jgi:hypothetical protein
MTAVRLLSLPPFFRLHSNCYFVFHAHQGFSPFSIDVKPKHGSPDFARDVAFKKIANRIKGAELASEQLKV